jgi:hypothetical protein
MMAHSDNELVRDWCLPHQCRFAAGQHVSLAEVAGLRVCCDQLALYTTRNPY